jgi:hypothetical protein
MVLIDSTDDIITDSATFVKTLCKIIFDFFKKLQNSKKTQPQQVIHHNS